MGKPHFYIACLILSIFVLWACPSFAQKMDGEFPNISTQELAIGIKNKSIFVVDANLDSIYQKQHIPSAIHADFFSPNVKIFPQDKNFPLVFYCKNVLCDACHIVARFAKEKGYTNIRVYPLGIEGWMSAGMAVEGLSLPSGNFPN
jgi:rhodanese-related sulfurtransferase